VDRPELGIFFANPATGLLGGVDLELGELGGDVCSGAAGLDLFVDGEDFAVLADVDGVAERDLALFGDRPVGRGDLAVWVC